MVFLPVEKSNKIKKSITNYFFFFLRSANHKGEKQTEDPKGGFKH